MKLSHRQLRTLFAEFWSDRRHKEIPPIPLVPKDDPTTLFTGSGMQQLVPYLLGEPHPLGEKLFNIQPCFRSQDIEEIGDNRHTTFFEMMGNWSLGTYFKKEQLSWFFEFLVDKVGLDPRKLYVTVFKGESGLPKDEESIEIWKEVYEKYGVSAKEGERILLYGGDKNWWSRGGAPKDQPVGEPGGPDSEVFYDFGAHYKLHEQSPYKNQKCHVNCDCGRFVEIGNSVFMQYRKQPDGVFTELPKKNVDFGGGLERILVAATDNPDIFLTDAFTKIIDAVERLSKKSYKEPENKTPMRIIADHMKVATFLIALGIKPSNKEHGYVLRRLLRRSAVKMRQLAGSPLTLASVTEGVIETYKGVDGLDQESRKKEVASVVTEELDRFAKSLERGVREINKLTSISGKTAFDLYQNFGFPLEITEELFKEKGHIVNRAEFRAEFEKHKEQSRVSSTKKFKGGLADTGEQTVKYHTATHLLHQALFDVLGADVRQDGSNITAERLRFDFYTAKKVAKEDMRKAEKIINQKVLEALPVIYKIIPREEAFTLGAKAFFKEKYAGMVKVYAIGAKDGDLKTAYSLEFCGGPHVTNTSQVGHIEIYKFEKIGSNLYRVYAK